MSAPDREPIPPRYLTTAEAAHYLRFRSTSGIRTAVLRGELRPAGAGPKCCHLFTVDELDRFVSARAARYARRNLGTPGDRKDPPREEQGNSDTLPRRVPHERDDVLDSCEGDRPSDGKDKGGSKAARGSDDSASRAGARRADGSDEEADRRSATRSRWGLREIVARVQSAKAGSVDSADVHGRAGRPHPARTR